MRVLTAAATLGYVLNASARAMSARRTFTLGVFVREASTPFYGHLLTAMQERAASRGYRVVAATGAGTLAVDEERRALETLVMLHVEGLVVCSGLLSTADVLAVGSRVPTVVAGRPEAHPDVYSVSTREAEGGAAIAAHVASLGHRRVLVIRYDATQTLTLAPRSAAICAELRARGVQVEEVAGTRSLQTSLILERLRTTPAITAVMSPNDAYAVRLLGDLAAGGIAVPGQVSVTGYDGVGPFSEDVIGLTTWCQPVEAIGALAVDTVLALVAGEQAPRHQRLTGHLVSGRTVSPPSR